MIQAGRASEQFRYFDQLRTKSKSLHTIKRLNLIRFEVIGETIAARYHVPTHRQQGIFQNGHEDATMLRLSSNWNDNDLWHDKLDLNGIFIVIYQLVKTTQWSDITAWFIVSGHFFVLFRYSIFIHYGASVARVRILDAKLLTRHQLWGLPNGIRCAIATKSGPSAELLHTTLTAMPTCLSSPPSHLPPPLSLSLSLSLSLNP